MWRHSPVLLSRLCFQEDPESERKQADLLHSPLAQRGHPAAGLTLDLKMFLMCAEDRP